MAAATGATRRAGFAIRIQRSALRFMPHPSRTPASALARRRWHRSLVCALASRRRQWRLNDWFVVQAGRHSRQRLLAPSRCRFSPSDAVAPVGAFRLPPLADVERNRCAGVHVHSEDEVFDLLFLSRPDGTWYNLSRLLHPAEGESSGLFIARRRHCARSTSTCTPNRSCLPPCHVQCSPSTGKAERSAYPCSTTPAGPTRSTTCPYSTKAPGSPSLFRACCEPPSRPRLALDSDSCLSKNSCTFCSTSAVSAYPIKPMDDNSAAPAPWPPTRCWPPGPLPTVKTKPLFSSS